MIRKIDHRNEAAAEEIVGIQRSAYLIEAELMGFDGIPQLKETLFELQSSDEVFFGCYDGEVMQGFISFKKEQRLIDIHRLAVDPAHFRKGVARLLLAYLMDNFTDTDFIVSTGKANVPAKKLYESFGFIEMKDFEVAPGIFCTMLEKKQSISEQGEN